MTHRSAFDDESPPLPCDNRVRLDFTDEEKNAPNPTACPRCQTLRAWRRNNQIICGECWDTYGSRWIDHDPMGHASRGSLLPLWLLLGILVALGGAAVWWAVMR